MNCYIPESCLAGSPPQASMTAMPGTAVRQNRIDGFDLARGVAVLGMILVNFHSIFKESLKPPPWYTEMVMFLYGRAAVLFVLLAGVGVGLMARRYLAAGDLNGLTIVRRQLLRRSMVLFIWGVIFLKCWSADILHYYGVFLAIASILLASRPAHLLLLSTAILLVSSAIYVINAWNSDLLDLLPYLGDIGNEIDDLLFNGYYSFFPWLTFLLLGMWLVRGRLLFEKKLLRQGLAYSLVIFVLAEGVDSYAQNYLPEEFAHAYQPYLAALIINNVFPVSPIFAISAIAGGLAVIFAMMLLSARICSSMLAAPLRYTGKLSLSIYVGHVLLGLGLEKIFISRFPTPLGSEWALLIIFTFLALTLLNSVLWFKFYRHGPLEWLMRRLSI